jgi:pimeloyl-ACP methyl ester carboxylesterase
VVSGGDIGSRVAEALAVRAPDNVAAPHLTDIPCTYIFSVDAAELTPDEQSYLAAGGKWQMTEGAYALAQSTKPHTPSIGLGDSPALLLASRTTSFLPRDRLPNGSSTSASGTKNPAAGTLRHGNARSGLSQGCAPRLRWRPDTRRARQTGSIRWGNESASTVAA